MPNIQSVEFNIYNELKEMFQPTVLQFPYYVLLKRDKMLNIQSFVET